MRLLLAPAVVLLATPAAAQTTVLKTSPGKPVQVGYYSFLKNDCSGGAKPAFKLSAPIAHGQVIVTPGTLTTKKLERCGTVKAPTLVVIYKPDATFTGDVTLSFDITNPESGRTQHIDASVDIQPPGQKI